MTTLRSLTPRLVVPSCDEAIDFYEAAFGAKRTEQLKLPDGTCVHAAMQLGTLTLTLTDENKGFGNLAPGSLGGTPVVLSLEVEDVDALWARAVEAGAEIVFPLGDQFYGAREGRVRDPMGHLWILSKTLETLTPEEMERRMAAWAG